MDLKSFIEKNKPFVIAFFAMGIVVLGIQFFKTSEPETSQKSEPSESVDTMIPPGYVLIPLELENLEQVSSLIGNSGVVDLYTGASDQKKRKLVASRVKVIQAPYNPQVYAALVREVEGALIQNYIGPLRAAVQNPKQEGAKVARSLPSRFSITYQR
jgi:hypothetical protein